MTINCSRFRFLLQKRFDTELAPQDERMVTQHVDSCDSCGRFQHQIDQVCQSAHEVPLPEECLPASREALSSKVLQILPVEKQGIFAKIKNLMGGGAAKKDLPSKPPAKGSPITGKGGPNTGRSTLSGFPHVSRQTANAAQNESVPSESLSGRNRKLEETDELLATSTRLRSLAKIQPNVESTPLGQEGGTLAKKMKVDVPVREAPKVDGPASLAETIKWQRQQEQQTADASGWEVTNSGAGNSDFGTQAGASSWSGAQSGAMSAQSGFTPGGFSETTPSFKGGWDNTAPTSGQAASHVQQPGSGWGEPAAGASDDGWGISPAGAAQSNESWGAPAKTATQSNDNKGNLASQALTSDGWGNTSAQAPASDTWGNPAAQAPASDTWGNPAAQAPASDTWGNPAAQAPASDPWANSAAQAPASDGWGNPAAQAPASDGWGNPAAQAPASDGWGNPAAQAPASDGWGNPAAQAPASDSWGSPASQAPASDSWGSPASQAPTSDSWGSPASQAPTSDSWGSPASQAPASDSWGSPASQVPASDSWGSPASQVPASDSWGSPASQVPASDSWGSPASQVPASDSWGSPASQVPASDSWGSPAPQVPASDTWGETVRKDTTWGSMGELAATDVSSPSESTATANVRGSLNGALPETETSLGTDTWSEDAEQIQTGMWKAFSLEDSGLGPEGKKTTKPTVLEPENYEMSIQERMAYQRKKEAERADEAFQPMSKPALEPAAPVAAQSPSAKTPANQRNIMDRLSNILGSDSQSDSWGSTQAQDPVVDDLVTQSITPTPDTWSMQQVQAPATDISAPQHISPNYEMSIQERMKLAAASPDLGDSLGSPPAPPLPQKPAVQEATVFPQQPRPAAFTQQAAAAMPQQSAAAMPQQSTAATPQQSAASTLQQSAAVSPRPPATQAPSSIAITPQPFAKPLAPQPALANAGAPPQVPPQQPATANQVAPPPAETVLGTPMIRPIVRGGASQVVPAAPQVTPQAAPPPVPAPSRQHIVEAPSSAAPSSAALPAASNSGGPQAPRPISSSKPALGQPAARPPMPSKPGVKPVAPGRPSAPNSEVGGLKKLDDTDMDKIFKKLGVKESELSAGTVEIQQASIVVPPPPRLPGNAAASIPQIPGSSEAGQLQNRAQQAPGLPNQSIAARTGELASAPSLPGMKPPLTPSGKQGLPVANPAQKPIQGAAQEAPARPVNPGAGVPLAPIPAMPGMQMQSAPSIPPVPPIPSGPMPGVAQVPGLPGAQNPAAPPAPQLPATGQSAPVPYGQNSAGTALPPNPMSAKLPEAGAPIFKPGGQMPGSVPASSGAQPLARPGIKPGVPGQPAARPPRGAGLLGEVDDAAVDKLFDKLGLKEGNQPQSQNATAVPKLNVREAVNTVRNVALETGQIPKPANIAGIGRLSSATENEQDKGSGKISSIGKFLLDQQDQQQLGRLTQQDLAESKVRVLTLEAADEIYKLLNHITTLPGVIGSCIVGLDGIPIANNLPQEYDPETVGALSFGIYVNTTNTIRKMTYNHLHQLVARTLYGFLVIADFGGGILITASNGQQTEELLPLMRSISELVNQK